MRGPDFICIGAQRSGTTWLHRSLEQHPQLWLTPVKEIHYFNGKAEEKRKNLKLHNFKSPVSYNWWNDYFSSEPINDDWYCSLFNRAQEQGLTAGESSPSYATLDDYSIAQIQKLNPGVKIIFIMKNPVQRAWSAAMKDWVKKYHDRKPVIDEMLARECKPALFSRSTYINTIEKIEPLFPKENIYYGFYDDLVLNPDIFLQNIVSFLGANPIHLNSKKILPTRSTSALMPIPDIFKREYAIRILPSLDRLCERFEGPPQAWRNTYREFLKHT